MSPNSLLNISAAILHYRQLFQPIEVPWTISEEAGRATCPDGGCLAVLQMGNEADFLPASAEQSFIDLMLQGKLSKGRYMAISPCFRNDPVDELHQKVFLKLELITVEPERPEIELSSMTWFAKTFFKNFGRVSIETTPVGYDITYGGIELGSYGVRTYQDHVWVYGTGCAEPRTTLAFQ